jgi:hypothetical protein
MTWSSKIGSRQLPTQPSAIPFYQGDSTRVRFGSSPVACKNVITSATNFESRFRITWRGIT